VESPNNRFVVTQGGVCSFCEKERPETEKVAEAKSPSIKICEDCAALCVDIMSEGDRQSPPSAEDWQKALGRLKATQQAWNQSRMKETPPPISSEQPMMSMKAEQLANLLKAKSETEKETESGAATAAEVVITNPELAGIVVCSICNTAREKVQKIITGPNVGICNHCVGEVVRLLNVSEVR
jgi:hypothetical protein